MRWLAKARAPGGKAGADSPSAYRDTGRLVTFSDAVFAITVTLLVLEIRPPTDYGNLLHGLLALWPSYLAYGVTFLFIGQVWANHHVMYDHIRAADRVVLLLNTLLLMRSRQHRGAFLDRPHRLEGRLADRVSVHGRIAGRLP
jgi:hypothetical protein